MDQDDIKEPILEVEPSKNYQIIHDLYTNPQYGFTHPTDIYHKLKNGINPENKKYEDISFDEVQQVLRSINSYTLNKRKAKPRQFYSYSASAPFAYLQADLAFFDEWKADNDGHGCLLTVIDVYSRYAFARWLKSKAASVVTPAFAGIIEEIKAKGFTTHSIQTDDGGEFFNKTFQKYLDKEQIKLYSIESPYGAAIVERFNRTLKQRFIKYTTETQSRRYIDVTESFIYNYNNTYHTTIEMTPTEAITELTEAKKPEYALNKEDPLPIYQLVRVVNDKHIFGKEIHNNAFTIELFRVDKRFKVKEEPDRTKPNAKPRIKYAYKLVDLLGEPLKGMFYREDLALVAEETLQQPFPIEEVIKRERDRSLVKFVGYPEKFNKWIPNNLISQI